MTVDRTGPPDSGSAPTPPRAHEAVEEFARLGPAEGADFLARLDEPTARVVLHEAERGAVARLLRRLNPAFAAGVWKLLPGDDRAGIARHLPEEFRERLRGALSPEEREVLDALLARPEGTAGGRMSPNFVSLPEGATVAQALAIVRAAAAAETVFYLYVVDATGRLRGTLSVRRLITSPPEARVRDLMVPDPIRVREEDSVEEASRLLDAHRFLALPVVDGAGRISGILTADDARRGMGEQVERAMFEVTGVDPEEEAETAPWRAAALRVPWLLVTVSGGLGCAFLAGLFESTLEEAVALALFIPLVLGLGESVAAQTLAVVLKRMGRAAPSARRGKVLANEIAVGLLAGLAAGALVGGVAALWRGPARLGLAVGLSIAIALSWAALLGSAIPFLLHGRRVDPAVAAGPVTLALADLSTLAVYFSVARALLEAG